MLRIGKISELYGIPVSTLHYWEKKGLISPVHNKENNYAEYDAGEVFARLGDIISYRNIDIPVKDVKKIKTSSPDTFENILKKNKARIEKKVEEYEYKLSQINKKLSYIQELKEANWGEFEPRPIPFTRAVEVHPLYSPELIKKYLSDLSRFVIVGDIDEDGTVTEHNCVAVDDEQGDTVFRYDEKATYLMTYCRIAPVASVPVSSAELIKKLTALKYKTSRYICQFLINLCDENGVLYEYYRIWFKID